MSETYQQFTSTLSKDDAEIFFYIGSSLDICDSDVWAIFDAIKMRGITTLNEYCNTL